MKFSPSLYSLCLILCILTGCTNQQEKDQKLLEEKISRIENSLQSGLQIHYGDSVSIQYYNIEDRMKELGIPGVSIAMMHNGEIEWAKGYGIADSLENRKVTPETLFQAGSISKPVAATRTHQLVDKGLIHLDTNVNAYLNSWKLPENEFTLKEKVTLRRILNHSAGLTVWGFPGYKRGERIPSTPEILDGLGNTDSVRVYKEPGGNWRYSGGGYTIMQLMISDIDQEEFPKVMKEKVLDPLGMTTSTYRNPLPEKYHSMAATGYQSNGTQVEGKWNVYPEMAAAGLWTTPSDLLLWCKEIQHIFQTQQDGLLKAATVNEMLKEYDGKQGLGPYVRPKSFGHYGADQGFRAHLLTWKESQNAAVIMVNSNKGNTIMGEIMHSIVKEYNLPDYRPTIRVYKEQSQEKLQRFIGKYDFRKRGISNMIVKEHGLEFSQGVFTNPVFLLPETDSTFFNKKTGTRYNFRFKEGKVTGVKFSTVEGEKVN